MKNTQEDFSSRKNTYNSSPITLAEQIYKACEQGNGAAVFLYSGQPLPKEEYPFLDELIGKYMMLNHPPTQMDILLFLGKNSTCITKPAIVLQIMQVQARWIIHLCRYRKEDGVKDESNQNRTKEERIREEIRQIIKEHQKEFDELAGKDVGTV